MKLGLYAIVDKKTCEIVAHTITQFRHVAPAIRMFQDAMAHANFKNHLGDFELWRLGYMQESQFEQPHFFPQIESDAEMITDGTSLTGAIE